MRSFPLVLVVIGAILGLLLLASLALAAGMFNRLVRLRNRFKNAFAQIDVQLKRRYDLIPNLVETAKSYMQHERETLEAVIAARNQALNAEKSVAANPAAPGAMRSLSGAEGVLGGAMGRLFAVMEQYPDLKADRTMGQLMEELSSTENKVAFARQAYNDAVMSYNNARETFPSNFIAGMFDFREAEMFEVTEAVERETPQVSFD